MKGFPFQKLNFMIRLRFLKYFFPIMRTSHNNICRFIIFGLFVILWGGIINMNLFASGRIINVEYKHSRRIEYNRITVELGSENNSEKIFYAKLFSKNFTETNDHSTTERSMNVKKEYFDCVYDKLLNLNFREIVENSEGVVGTDGSTISITLGTNNDNIKITLWSPDYKPAERKTEELNIIIRELFSLFDMEEWL